MNCCDVFIKYAKFLCFFYFLFLVFFFFFFFFSSRRRYTRWNCDWSSDVCSSDLLRAVRNRGRLRLLRRFHLRLLDLRSAGLDRGRPLLTRNVFERVSRPRRLSLRLRRRSLDRKSVV